MSPKKGQSQLSGSHWKAQGTWVDRDLQTVMDQLRIGTMRKQASKESGWPGCRQCEYTWNQVAHFAAPTNQVTAAGSAGISTPSPCLSEISHNTFPNCATDAARLVCHSSWACPERSKHFWPSANTQFTTLFFFHKRQTLSRHVSTSSGVGSIIREGLWGRQALIDFWACAGWWSTLPPQTLHLLVAEQLPPAWCQPDSGMQLLRVSDLPLDVRWLVSRERYQKHGVRSCIMPLRILTRATAWTLIPFSKRICESLPLVSSLLLSVIAHCSIWSPTQLLSKDFFDLSLLYCFIFLIPNSAVHFIIWT